MPQGHRLPHILFRFLPILFALPFVLPPYASLSISSNARAPVPSSQLPSSVPESLVDFRFWVDAIRARPMRSFSSSFFFSANFMDFFSRIPVVSGLPQVHEGVSQLPHLPSTDSGQSLIVRIIFIILILKPFLSVLNCFPTDAIHAYKIYVFIYSFGYGSKPSLLFAIFCQMSSYSSDLSHDFKILLRCEA